MTVLRRVLFSAAAVLLVALAAVARPAPAVAQVCYDCGAYRGVVCKETKACVWYLFGSICTTKTYRYPVNAT
ncbi:MAG TPA: hypothetical protein VJ957_12270 [Longimicrobiales bacterium]|nr:hypothetical protein [Longimicrobiales bacterium]